MTKRGEEGSASGIPAIPDHELVRLIGKGSYGDIWLARNALGTYRAVKVVCETSFGHKRPFEREFNGVQKFEPISRQHAGLVDVLHVGRSDTAQYFYCVMELADDVVTGQAIDPDNYTPRTLAYDIAGHKRLPIQECRRIGRSIGSALDFLHRQGLIHRDVKPSNIIFVNGAPKLADIGLVAETTEARSYVGTEGFIPPEGPGTAQADIYSFGKVLYEISTGKDRHEYPELPAELSEVADRREFLEFNKIFLRACRSDLRERYRSAREMTDDLRALDRGEKVSVWTTPRRLREIGLKSGAVVSCLLTIVVSSRYWRTPGPAPTPAGLVGWWSAEGNGEDSAGGHDGLLYGVGFAKGNAGRAFDIVPPWHRVWIPDCDDFKLTNALTIEGWVYARKGGGIVFHRGDDRGGLDPYWMAMTGAGQIDFGVDESLETNVHILAPIAYNQWQHVAGAFDSANGEMKLYVNGALAAYTNTKARPLRDLDPDKAPAIGIGNTGSFHQNLSFDGLIDEFALYSRALSAAEIERIYKAGSKGKYLSASRHRSFSATGKDGAAQSVAPIPPGIIGWWRGEGDALDATGNRHGILRNGVSFAPGKVGKAFKFNGTNSFVEIPRVARFDLTNQVTLEFWMKADLENPMNACCQGLVTSDYYCVEISSTVDPVGVDFCIVHEEGSTSINTCDVNNGGAVISSGEWHHIGATCDGAELQLYVDGRPWKKATPYTQSIPRMHPRSFIAIGSEDGRTICPMCIGTRYFKGMIDEVTIYDRALSAGEIAAIYEAGSAGKAR